MDADLETMRRSWPHPAPPSTETRTAGRAALLHRATARTGRAAPPHRAAARTGRGASRLGLRASLVGALAVAITVATFVVGDRPASVVPGLSVPAANAQTVLRRAADLARARSFAAPRPDQWVYIETRYREIRQARPQTADTPLDTRVDRVWTRADGKKVAHSLDGKLEITATGGLPPVDYATVSSLPEDPDKLLAWMYRQLAFDQDREKLVFALLGLLLDQNMVPPAQEAAAYQAMAKIPGVRLNPNAVDLDGRPALAVARTEDGWMDREILLDPATYAYRGSRVIAVADHTTPANGSTTVDNGVKILNLGTPRTIKKGTILFLSLRLRTAITDRLGQLP